MPEDVYKVLMDVSDALGNCQRFAKDGLAPINNSFKSVNTVAGVFNKEMQNIGLTLTGTAENGEKLSKTVLKMGDSWQTTSAKISNGYAKLQEYKEGLVKLTADLDKIAKDRAAAETEATNNLKNNLTARTQAQQYAVAQSKAIAKEKLEIDRKANAAIRQASDQQKAQENALIANLKANVAAREAAIAYKKELNSAIEAEKRAKQGSDDYLLSWRNILRFFEARLLYNSVSQITGAVQDGVSRAVEFEQTLGRITTLVPATAGTYREWGESVKRVADAFGTDAQDTAKSYYTALSNQIGNSIQEIESFTGKAAEFARVTGASAEQANDLFSSAINAFGKSAADATDIAAKFFKTIDLGRVTAAGLSGSFGRTAVAAATLGVKYEELLASLSVLSRQGVTDADAQTQTLNLFNKLIKPTEKLKEMLEEWGYASGQALIANEGLVGVLGRLDSELQSRGVARLGELINDIRGLRGTFGLTGKGLNEFRSDLAQITGSQDDYTKAIQRTSDTLGFKLAKQLNEVKTAFTSMGQNALGVILPITDALGGLTGAIKIVIATAITLGTTLYGLRAATAVVGGMKIAWTALTTTVTSGTALMTGGVSLLVGALASWLLLSESAEQKFQRSYAEGLESIREQTKQAVDAIAKSYEKLKILVSDSFKPVLESARQMRAAYSAALKDIDGGFKKLKETLAGFEKATFDGLEDSISAVKSRISELKGESKSLTAELNKAFRTEALEDFRDKIDDLSSGKKAKAIETEITRAIKNAVTKAKASVAAGDIGLAVKSYDEARQEIELVKSLTADLKSEGRASVKDKQDADRELARLSKKNIERAQEELELQRRVATAANELRANRGRNKDESLEDANNRQLLAANRLADAQDALNRHIAETKAAQERVKKTSSEIYDVHKGLTTLQIQLTDATTALNEANQKMLDLETQRLKTLEAKKAPLIDIFKEISDLMTSKDTGLTSDETIAKINKLRDEYKKVVDVSTNPAAFIQLLEYTDKIIERSRTVKNIQDVDKLNMDAMSAREESLKRINELEAKQKLLYEKRADLVVKANELAKNSPSYPQNWASGLGSSMRVDQQVRDYKAMFNELTAILTKAKELPDTLALNSPRLREIVAKLQEIRIESGGAFNKTAIIAVEDVATTIAEITKTSTQLDKVSQEQKTLIELAPAVNEALTVPMLNGAKAAETLEEKLRRIQATTRAMTAEMRAANVLSSATPTVQISEPQAGGGFPRFAGGGQPYGSDKIHSLLSPGEFVVNAGASKKFYSQLVAMNSGSRNYAGGGNVTSNVGDINISMQSGGNASTDVVRIGKLLRREIKRGTLKL